MPETDAREAAPARPSHAEWRAMMQEWIQRRNPTSPDSRQSVAAPISAAGGGENCGAAAEGDGTSAVASLPVPRLLVPQSTARVGRTCQRARRTSLLLHPPVRTSGVQPKSQHAPTPARAGAVEGSVEESRAAPARAARAANPAPRAVTQRTCEESAGVQSSSKVRRRRTVRQPRSEMQRRARRAGGAQTPPSAQQLHSTGAEVGSTRHHDLRSGPVTTGAAPACDTDAVPVDRASVASSISDRRCCDGGGSSDNGGETSAKLRMGSGRRSRSRGEERPPAPPSAAPHDLLTQLAAIMSEEQQVPRSRRWPHACPLTAILAPRSGCCTAAGCA